MHLLYMQSVQKVANFFGRIIFHKGACIFLKIIKKYPGAV
jgi:hypothetical protein